MPSLITPMWTATERYEDSKMLSSHQIHSLSHTDTDTQSQQWRDSLKHQLISALLKELPVDKFRGTLLAALQIRQNVFILIQCRLQWWHFSKYISFRKCHKQKSKKETFSTRSPKGSTGEFVQIGWLEVELYITGSVTLLLFMYCYGIKLAQACSTSASQRKEEGWKWTQIPQAARLSHPHKDMFTLQLSFFWVGCCSIF